MVNLMNLLIDLDLFRYRFKTSLALASTLVLNNTKSHDESHGFCFLIFC